MTVFVGNTNVLELLGLKSAIEDAFVNDADVTVTVKDKAGEEVAGQTWPTTMDYLAASDGNYRAIVKDTIQFVHDKEYRAFIEVDAGADRIGHWEFKFTPTVRTGA
jgi:hypothetical protein